MKLKFTYDRVKDIWCLLSKGPSSQNSNFPTGVYKQLIASAGENPTEKETSKFIDIYLEKNDFDIAEYLQKYQKEFDTISEEFCERTEKIFGVSLPEDITVYLTVNNRCPYNLNDNWFFVSLNKEDYTNMIAMHELWHFYTFYKFGEAWKSIGQQKYNDIKESLTVLLNIECSDLLREGIKDNGYPQHQKIREQIIDLWKENQSIDYVWHKIVEVI